jgi:hypothetical protein
MNVSTHNNICYIDSSDLDWFMKMLELFWSEQLFDIKTGEVVKHFVEWKTNNTESSER